MDRLGTLQVTGASLSFGLLVASGTWLVNYVATQLFPVELSWPLVIAAFVVSFSGVLGYWGYHRVMLDVQRMVFEHHSLQQSDYALTKWEGTPMPDASTAADGTFERDVPLNTSKGQRNLTIVETLSPNVQAWYKAMATGLKWAWQANSMNARDLVGKERCFSTPEGWGMWKGVLQALGMIVSTQGKGTFFTPGWDYKKSIAFFESYSPVVFPAQKAPTVQPWRGAPLSPTNDDPEQQ